MGIYKQLPRKIKPTKVGPSVLSGVKEDYVGRLKEELDRKGSMIRRGTPEPRPEDAIKTGGSKVPFIGPRQQATRKESWQDVATNAKRKAMKGAKMKPNYSME